MKQFLLIFLSSVTLSISAAPIHVEIFTISSMPVGTTISQSADIHYYTVDTASNLLIAFNNAVAQHQNETWFIAHQSQLQQAFKGLELAEHYGITQLPAIVFDHKAIIEGNQSFASALSEYMSWQTK
jgi:hypothetical protein